MARGKKKGVNGVVSPPDFEMAARIVTNDVVPANKAQKSAMSEASAAWKEIKNEAHVQVGGFRTALKVSQMEEAEQQAFLRSLRGGFIKFGVALHSDMVDAMEGGQGDNGIDIIPTGDAPALDLSDVSGALN